MSGAPPRRAAIAFIFVTIVLDVLAIGIIVPVLPKLVEDFVQGDTVRASEVFGVFGTAWALMQFFCSPILGALSDRFGRRPVLLASMLGLGLDYVLMALAPSLGWLFLGRVISGMTAASFSTANAYIADITKPEDRPAAFGLMGAAFGLGFVLGPAVGGVLGSYGPRVPFWVAAAFSTVNALYGLFVLPESLPPERRVPFAWSRANPLGALRLLRSNPQLFALATTHFLSAVGQNVYPAVFVLSSGYRFGWDEKTVGLTLAGVGVSSMVVQGGLVRPVVKRLGERASLLVGLLFSALGFVGFGLAPSAVFMWAAIPISALGGFYSPAAQGLMTRRVDATHQGQLQGALSGLLGISALVSPGMYTQTFARSIDGSFGVILPGAPFLLAGALVFAGLALGWRATRPG